MSHPSLRLVSTVPTLGWLDRRRRRQNVEIFASFFGAVTQRQKRLRGTAGLFVEFFDTQRDARWGLILVRPTCARHWLAQPRFDTGSPNWDLFLCVFARFWDCTLLHPDCTLIAP